MQKEKMDEVTNSIIKKVGKEMASQIADDIGLIITDNNNMLGEIEKRDTKINELTTKNENLISANGNLLQQIAVGTEENLFGKKEKEEEKPKEITYKELFDEKGNFKN